MKVPCILLPALLLPLVAGCDYPMDADGTLDRVRSEHLMRVGVSENPPFVVLDGELPTGIEPALVQKFAVQLGARVEWTRGSESSLAEVLGKRKIDLAIGGFMTDSPWLSHSGPTQPFLGDRVMLGAPGENAFVLALDRFLAEGSHSGGIPPEGTE
jgi:polar amino acid transport system substrate-binding protein